MNINNLVSLFSLPTSNAKQFDYQLLNWKYLAFNYHFLSIVCIWVYIIVLAAKTDERINHESIHAENLNHVNILTKYYFVWKK